MAFVICPKHGGHGAAAVCEHLSRAIAAAERIGPTASLTVEYEGTRLGPIRFCTPCANLHGIPAEGLILTGDAGVERMFEWGWTPICPVCFRDAGGPAESAGQRRQ